MVNTPLRVLFLNPFPGLTGAEITLLELMRHLPPHEFNPILMTSESGPLTQAAQTKGIRAVTLPSLPVEPISDSFYRTWLPTSLRIARYIRDERITLIHSNTPRGGYFSGLAARICRIPSIIHVRDLRQPPFQTRLKRWLFNQITDVIILVSQAQKEKLTDQLGSLAPKVRVVYDGLPPTPPVNSRLLTTLKNDLGLTEAFPILIQIGWLEPLKGQEISIRAMPSILESFPKARLLLVGNAINQEGKYYQNKLVDLTKSFEITSNVSFLGFRNDVPDLLAISDLVLHPATQFDALPHVLLEAAAQGKPVIASNIGGIPEIVQDGQTGIVIAPGDHIAIANAILLLLRDDVRVSQMGAAAKQRIDSCFSIECHVNEITDIYKYLLAKPGLNRNKRAI